jgi:protein-tyrosine phosphatase
VPSLLVNRGSARRAELIDFGHIGAANALGIMPARVCGSNLLPFSNFASSGGRDKIFRRGESSVYLFPKVGRLSRATGSKEKLGEAPRVVVDFDLLRRIGGRNFRDLGGHPITGGQRVQRGKIYRSAHLAQIPQESPHPLAAIRLRTLVTLQSQLEVRHLGPPRAEFLESGVRWEHIPIGDSWFRDDGFYKIETPPGHEHLVIVTEFRNGWQSFFKLLAERDVYPLVFHCSAGRDRTGVGAVLLLELLGVNRELIVADFLESNTTFPKMPLKEQQLAPIFALVDESAGIENFLLDTLGLDVSDLEAIREDLLEPDVE